MRKIFGIILLGSIGFFSSISGRAEMPLKMLDIQARSIALGRSTLAVPYDFSASLNPAVLGTTTTAALCVSQARLAYDQYGYQAQVLFPGPGRFSLRFDQLIVQNSSYERLLYNSDGTPVIDPITNQQMKVLTYDMRVDSLWGLGYGLQVFPGGYAGWEGQMIHLKIGEDYAWGFDGSAGFLYNPWGEHCTLGIVWQQLNREWLAWRMPYKTELGYSQIGVGFCYLLAAIQTQVFGSLQQSLQPEVLPRGRIGFEYSGLQPLTMRLGYDAEHISLGAGFHWQNVFVEYAAITGDAVYDANRITIKIEF